MRQRLYSIPLSIALPALVLAVFGLLAGIVYVHETDKWYGFLNQARADAMHREMMRLQRAVGGALAAGRPEQAERELTMYGVEPDVEALAAIDAEGRVLYGTRFAWKARVAAAVLPGFDVHTYREASGGFTPRIRNDGRYLSAYYPLPLAPAGGELRARAPGMLYMQVDAARQGHLVDRMVREGNGALWLAVAAATGLLIVALRRFVARPLRQLGGVAGLLAEGSMEPIAVRGRGELARLAHAFNEAGTKLSLLFAELRDREQRYRTIVDHASVGILLVNRDFHVVEMNRTLREWLRSPVEYGRCYRVLTGDGDAEQCGFCNVSATFADGRTREALVRFELRRGERTLRVVTSPVKDAAGVVVACVNIFEDITEAEETRLALAKATRALRALSACNSAVVRATEEGQLLQQVCTAIVKEGGYRLAWIGRAEHGTDRRVRPVGAAGSIGYLDHIDVSWNDEAIGRGPIGVAIRERRVVVVTDVTNAEAFQPWRHLAISHGFESVASLPLVVDGSVYGALAIYAAEPDAFAGEEIDLLMELADTLAHGIRALQDHAGLAESRRQLQRLNAELEQRVHERTEALERANRELEAFTYSVSHDLRAPLRAIDGFSQVLVNRYADRLDEQALDYLERVRRGSQRMGGLIDDLLGLSRINRHEIRRERLDLSALAADVVRELRAGEPQRQVAVAIEPGLTAVCDPRLARVVLDNLLGNAWKYTGRRLDAHIEFGAEAAGFVVRDNGAGFDMRYADKLFAPFQRLHQTSEFEGSGIGLASVQRAIERHGGTIRAEAVPGEGATFHFDFGPDASIDSGSRPGAEYGNGRGKGGDRA